LREAEASRPDPLGAGGLVLAQHLLDALLRLGDPGGGIVQRRQ
jgi:hypothetical protein